MRIQLRDILFASNLAVFTGFAGSASLAATAKPAQPQAVVDAPDGSKMQQRVEKRIADLHSSLHITDAQQPQWDGFANAMRDNARQMDATVITDVRTLAKMTAVEQ